MAQGHQGLSASRILFILVLLWTINRLISAWFSTPVVTSPAIEDTHLRYAIPSSSSSSPPLPSSKQKSFPIERWIDQSYNQTYALLERCPPNHTFFDCLTSTNNYLSIDGENNNTHIPWWFHTVIRDGANRKTGLHGPWHNLKLQDPRATVCAIEKIGCTQWRKMSCLLNDEQTFKWLPCHMTVKDKPDADPAAVPRIVFLRDPLERFLSAYIDKCIEYKNLQPHCEPEVVFNDPNNPLTEGLVGNKRANFEAYVDAFPLKWNMHFFPMSLYCDGLYRNIHDYAFVGNMDENFYHDLSALGDQFGSTMTNALESIYKVSQKVERNVQNLGLETSAPSHVKEYYSPRSIRRVLQYFSIDYIKLNLTVPDWAQEMLENDPLIVGR